MAWDQSTGEALGRGAAWLKQLRTLSPGQRLNLPMKDFQDMQFVVGGGLDSTWQEKVDWLCDRVDFPCRAWRSDESDAWIFERLTSPPP